MDRDSTGTASPERTDRKESAAVTCHLPTEVARARWTLLRQVRHPVGFHHTFNVASFVIQQLRMKCREIGLSDIIGGDVNKDGVLSPPDTDSVSSRV